MIVDGKQIAMEILARTKERTSLLAHQPKVVAFYASQTPATRSYLAIKTRRALEAGCLFEARPFPLSFLDADVAIVQLPLVAGMDQKDVCDAIPIEKDADVLSSAAREKFEKGEPDALLPPVVGAIHEIFAWGNFDPKGKKAVVIGDGWLVGKPATTWLRQQGAEVTVLNSKSGNLSAVLPTAELIVSGAGSPHLIKPDMLKKAKSAEGGSPDGSSDEPFRGVVLIDAGTSESNGILAGDADPACAAKCAIFTPVPGGVGPIAVAKLFENAVTLAERNLT